MENDFDGIKKLPYDLIPVIALDEVVQVLDFGREKHGAENWRTCYSDEDIKKLYGAALRHIFAWKRGEANDKETGVDHLAHAVCDLLFLQELKFIRKEKGYGKEDNNNNNQEADLT